MGQQRRTFAFILRFRPTAPSMERFSLHDLDAADGPASLTWHRQAAALARLLNNADVDMGDCSCVTNDTCPACAVREAFLLPSRT